MATHTYLHDIVFNFYCSGVYTGKIQFQSDRIMHAKVDVRQRTQMQENQLSPDNKFVLPFQKIHDAIGLFAETEWSGEEVTLANGDLYYRHIEYRGTVKADDRASGDESASGARRAPSADAERGFGGATVMGEGTCLGGVEVVSQVWARRKETAIDVITVDGKIIAFLCPNRYGMEVIVKESYEKLTPLVVYDEAVLSKAEYGVNDLGTFLVPMRDGVRLATDVFLPERVNLAQLNHGEQAGNRNHARPYEHEGDLEQAGNCEGALKPQKVPTILVRTCYDRNGKREALMRWANKGYAVVCQDVRGRSDSEGELVPFYHERDDGSDTIDWIVSQPWSDGNVGMWGASYLGYVVVAAATSGNPHLKAVVDEVNVGSPFVDTVRRGGTVCSWPLLCWTLAQSVGNRTDFDVFAGITVNPEAAVDARPITKIPQKMIGKPSGPWDLWSEHPEYDDFWRNCTFTENGHQLRVPMFIISGWYDGDSAGVSETWRMLTEHDVPNRKIWLGPWEHNPNRARDFHGQSFSNDAVVYDYDVRVLKWFDRFLKGMPNGIDEEPRATYYLLGENQWKSSEDWTPVEATIKEFYLASHGHANSSNGDGRISMNLPESSFAAADSPWNTSNSFVAAADSVRHPVESSYPASGLAYCPAPMDTFVYNPNHPFDDSGEREPENLRKYEIRNDILVYTSNALIDNLVIAGELSAEIYASSTGFDTDWVTTLSDVDEDGNSIRLSSYIVRAKYRHGFEKPELLVPGKVERFHIFMPNIAHTFQMGHKIRFSITSSSKFVAFPNPNTGENPYLESNPLIVAQTIYHTEEYPSHVKLPVLYGSLK